jgi:hypothetical protein
MQSRKDNKGLESYSLLLEMMSAQQTPKGGGEIAHHDGPATNHPV